MAKPILKFTAVPYGIGEFKGYRPQLEAQNPVSDLDFCREVVTEKRLAMSAEELLHALEMVGEVGPQKVAADGRPRAVSKLLKWNRFAKGKLESPTSPWNDSCRAVIRSQLLADVEKTIDASFVNVNSGIGVKLDNVTWIGAESVQNVIKVGVDFAAYGRHMEFIPDGETPDKAWLEFNDEKYELVNKSSDVSCAVFEFPVALAGIEPGSQVLFRMESRGGVEDGQVYPTKKLVTVIAGDTPLIPTVTRIAAEGSEDVIKNEAFYVTGTNLSYGAGDSVKVKWTQSGTAHEIAVTPSATTTTKMTFEPVAAFDDIPEGTFLTFVFNLRGQTEEFQTMLVDA